MDLRHLPEGTHSLAPRPGSLVRLAFQKWSAWQDSHLQPSRLERDASAIGLHADGAPGRICTDTERVLSRRRLCVGLRERNWCRVRDLHLQPPRSERSASCCWANAAKMALPAGLSPATWRFEAARSDNLSYGSIKWGRRGDSHSRGADCPAVYETAAVAAEPRRHEMVGRHGFAPCSAVKSRCFTVKVCSPIATRRRS